MIQHAISVAGVHGKKWCQDGCFNADPHPGNILLLEDGQTLGLIDFGQVMYLPQVVRLKHIFQSLVPRIYQKIS